MTRLCGSVKFFWALASGAGEGWSGFPAAFAPALGFPRRVRSGPLSQLGFGGPLSPPPPILPYYSDRLLGLFHPVRNAALTPAAPAGANNLQQSWRFDWEPPKAPDAAKCKQSSSIAAMIADIEAAFSRSAQDG